MSMRVAVLDLGSNSFHLLVADVHPDRTFTTVTREKEMLRLGDEVGQFRCIRAAAADRAVASLRRLHELALAHGATEVYAVATAAIRRAANGSALVDRFEAEAGVTVRVIDGLEEAELIFEAIRASVVLDPGPAVFIDIGGGSLEIGVGNRDGMLDGASVALGVGLLRAKFVSHDPPHVDELQRLNEQVSDVLLPVIQRLGVHNPTMLVGSSGTIGDLAAMTLAHAKIAQPRNLNHVTIRRSDFEEMHQRLLTMTSSERKGLVGLDTKRSDLIAVGSVVLDVAFDILGFESLTFSDWALREGILLQAVARSDPSQFADDVTTIREASVSALARKCNSRKSHCEHVRDLSLQLFDGLKELHGLGDADRAMLAYAVLLHDIGHHVSHYRHHEHAAYLVANSAMRGFDQSELQFLTALVRHHRKGDVKAAEQHISALSADDRKRCRKLAALLRVADGLDRGHRQRITRLRAVDNGDIVTLHLATSADPELEIWGCRRRSELFESVFGRTLHFSLHDSSGEID